MAKKSVKVPVQRKKKVSLRYQIDLSRPVEDGILQPDDFETYLKCRIKINGRSSSTGQPRYIRFERQRYKILVHSEVP